MHLNCSVQKVDQGTPVTISDARFYLGMSLVGATGGLAKVYAGDANTDPEVGAAGVTAANEVDHDTPSFPVPLTHGSPRDSLYVEVTGASNYALVYYST